MGMTLEVEKMEYDQLTEEIKRTMRRSAKDAVRLGFMLRRVMEERLWEAWHSNFDDYLREELHMEYSLASRFIAINKKYSYRGKSMDINPEYEEYSQGALIEMLNMPAELEEKVTPEMTVREVREIKRQAKQKKEKPVPEQEETEVVIDGEYREVLQKEEKVATSQEETPKELHDEYWFARQYMEILPGTAEKIIETCRAEEDSSKRGKVLQEIISPYGCHNTGCKEWDFYFHSFAKGLDMRIGTEKMHLTYNRFARVLMEVAAEEENADGTNEIEEKLSAYGLPVTEYPEGSLIATEGCGHKYYCFSCAQDCGIRQKDRYCREAPLGNPFPCTTMNVLGQLKEEMGDACRFINQEKAYHTKGTNEAVPCCKECQEICGYRCRRSVEQLPKEQEETVQPELPALKNTDQRKEWLRNYKAWGLWYRDENIDVNYYKYDFSDGSRLIAAEYPQRQDYWRKDAKDEYYFHLLEKDKEGYGKMRYDEKYRHNPDSETYLVEFLKNIQKK